MPEVSPDRIITMAAGFQQAKILLTANELGIFEALGTVSMRSDDIADKLRLDREATGILMGALVGLGLVTHARGRFRNAPDVLHYLTVEGEGGLGCITRHMNHVYDNWANLGRIVRKGRPKDRPTPKVLMDRKVNRDFICGMFEIGHSTAKLLAKAIDFKGVKRFVDIGGGPAQYPITFAGLRPDIEFVVADYPNTVRVAKDFVRRYGLSDRIKLKTCEFMDAKDLGIGEDYDMALLSQVLHAASDEKCVELIGKTRRLLRPGGRIIINENARDAGGMSPGPPLVFAVNMLVSNFGRTFTVTELKAWLKAAGFKAIKAKRLHERSVIIEGRK